MNSLTILLVDDDHDFHLMVKELLESQEHTVISAFDGQQASDLLEAETVDLLITDLLMPVKDGIRLITESKATNIKLPIIAMSGGQSEYSASFLESAKVLGAKQILPKPFKGDELLDRIALCFE